MRKLPLVCLLMLWGATDLMSQDNAKWDLRRCVEYAMNNNVQVKQADVQARISAVLLKQSRLQQVPTLSFGAQTGMSFGRTVDRTTNVYTDATALFQQLNVQANALIYNWGSQRNTIASNNYRFQADQANVDKIKYDIGLNVAQQYLVALLDRERVEVNRIQLEQTRSQLANTRKQVDAGSLPELNAAELESKFASDSATLVASYTQVEVDILTLKATLNLPADAPFEIATPPVESIPVDNILETSPAAVYQLAIQTQPLVKVNNLRLKSAEKSYQAWRGTLYPSISAFGQLSTNFFGPRNQFQGVRYAGDQQTEGYTLSNGDTAYVKAPVSIPFYRTVGFGGLWNNYGTQIKDNFGQNIGISINIPILNGWQARSNVAQARLEIRNRELAIEQDTLRLKQDIYTAYSQAYGAYQTFLARQKNVQIAQRSFDLANRRYEIGVMQTIEWLNNQNALYTARINQLIAQYDYVFRMKVLEYYKGQGIRL